MAEFARDKNIQTEEANFILLPLTKFIHLICFELLCVKIWHSIHHSDRVCPEVQLLINILIELALCGLMSDWFVCM